LITQVLPIALLVMRTLLRQITTQVNVLIVMLPAAPGQMHTSIMVDSWIVFHAMQEVLPIIITRDNAQIAMIRIAVGAMLNLIIVETPIVLLVMLEMLQTITIQGSAPIATTLTAGRVRDLITAGFPIAFRAI